MATPQRNIPNPPPNPAPLKDDPEVAKDVGAGVRFAWGWIVLAIIVILVVWFGGFGWGTYGGWWWGHHPASTTVQLANVSNGETPAANAGQPLNNGVPAAAGNNAALGDGVQILTSNADKAGFVGRPFVIRNVLVVEKNSSRAYWIGAPNVMPMLVVLTPTSSNSSNAGINQNTRVDVTGVVERTVSADQAKRMWSLSDTDAKRLEQEGAYVQATQMGPTPQSGRS